MPCRVLFHLSEGRVSAWGWAVVRPPASEGRFCLEVTVQISCSLTIVAIQLCELGGIPVSHEPRPLAAVAVAGDAFILNYNLHQPVQIYLE